MGHVLLAGPRIENFALVDAMVRLLQRRGTRVSVLATDRVSARFLAEHGIGHRCLQPSRRLPRITDEFDEFARREARLRGLPDHAPTLHAARDFLARRAGPLLRAFETDLPDVVLAIDARSGLDRLIHATARTFGCSTAHLGAGLIEGTLQRDTQGIDGDRNPPQPGSEGAADRALIDSAVAMALAGGSPRLGPLPRMVFRPRMLDRVRLRLGAHADGGRHAVSSRLRAWLRAADGHGNLPESTVRDLPITPFVAVLLQAADDPRIRLDVDGSAPHPLELVAAVRSAVQGLGLGEALVVVLDEHASHRTEILAIEGVRMVPHHAASTAAALATAVVTVNHPRGFVGTLASTPTFCIGRAMYAREGLARQVRLDALEAELLAARAERKGAVAHRAATSLLSDGHLWCDPARPDSNGLAGFAGWIESLLASAAPPPPPVRYDPGPVWPDPQGGTTD